MKLSVAWIFDHIDADWHTIKIEEMVNQFNQTIAEIEGYEKIDFNFSSFFYVQIKSIAATAITAQCPELKKDIMLPIRDDVQEGLWYLIKEENKNYIWAALETFCPSRQGFLPTIHIPETERSGGWKKRVEIKDYTIDVDNKSITHRPDLWSHRGIAREIAAMLNLKFKPLNNFVVPDTINEYDKSAPATPDNPISVEIKTNKCDRFAILYFDHVAYMASPWWMAHRLMRVGARPIDALIDVTNYVLFDVGQPLHVFDADTLSSKKLVIRTAKSKEKLVLLKDQEVELTQDDIVVTDGKEPISLAGIRGGLHSGVSNKTKRFLLESAHFDATTIRKTSMRIKIRTEASARFEKTLDPNQNIIGIERFIKLVQQEQIVSHVSAINSLGDRAEPKIVTVEHSFIESRLGVSVTREFVVKTLEKLEFAVTASDGSYTITIPTFRATKDVAIPEDIVEEIGRLYGYNTITRHLPVRAMAPFSIHEVQTRRALKQQLAYGLAMHEVSNYSFYDEQFLQQLGWQPAATISVENPISEHWRRLVTSLIPHLIKNIVTNKEHKKELSFFEIGRTWHLVGDAPLENQILAGIMFDAKKSVDFYEGKAPLEQLFALLALPVMWHKLDHHEKYDNPWWLTDHTAYIMHHDQKIGIAGILDPQFYVSVLSGNAYAFELDAQFLQNYKPPVIQYKPASKYPVVHRDISMFVPLMVTVDDIIKKIIGSDARISQVTLVDHFEKDEWPDKKSVTFSCAISDHTKTLTTQEIDALVEQAVDRLKKLGATIR